MCMRADEVIVQFTGYENLQRCKTEEVEELRVVSDEVMLEVSKSGNIFESGSPIPMLSSEKQEFFDSLLL